MRHPKRAAPSRQPLLPVLVLLAAGLLSLAGVTAARYVARQSESGLVSASAFYFTSDLLREGEEVPSYFVDPKQETIQVRLSNTEDGERVTGGDITYRVSVEGGTATASTGTLSGTAGTATVSVTPAEEKVTVTVTSTSPYEKKLSAVFVRRAGNQYALSDGNAAAVLTIICADDAREIKLTLPDGVLPDATDTRVKADSGGGYGFESPGPGVYSLTLLKTGTQKLGEIPFQNFADQIDLTTGS